MQEGMDRVPEACDSYDLTINTMKSEVVHQPPPGKPYNEPFITVKEQKEGVDKLKYFGKYSVKSCAHW